MASLGGQRTQSEEPQIPDLSKDFRSRSSRLFLSDVGVDHAAAQQHIAAQQGHRSGTPKNGVSPLRGPASSALHSE